MNSIELKKEILSRREQRLINEAGVYPRNNPTASSISECAREMVLSIVHWDKRPAFEPYVKARLEEGTRQESYVLRELLELGFNLVENNPPPAEIKDKKGRVILRGKIDGKIETEHGKRIPFEVKSLHPNVFNQVDNLQDFYRYFWMKKYISQMMTYLYFHNVEEGLFIIVDMLGHWKIIPIKLDYELMENILQLCEKVVECVDRIKANGGAENDHLPPHSTDFSLCRKCWANGRVCFPDLDYGEGAQFIDDIEIQELLKRHEDLKGYKKEFDQIDKQIKERFKNIPLVICGDYAVSGVERTRHFKAQPAKDAYDTTYWQSKIENIKEGNGKVQDG